MSASSEPQDLALPAVGAQPLILPCVPGFDAIASAITDPTWYLREDNYEPAMEHELESRFSVANGFLGIRGSLDIPTEASRPRTYIAGLFETRPEPPSLSSLVPAPQAFSLRLLINGEPLEIDHGTVLQHARFLDYRTGILRSVWKHELPDGQVVSLVSLRFASLADRNLAVQTLRLRLDRPAEITIEPHSRNQSTVLPTGEPAVFRTNTGSLTLVSLQRMRLHADGKASRWRELPSSDARVRCDRDFTLSQLTSFGLEARSEDARVQAEEALQLGKRSGLRRLEERHSRQWRERWQASDIVVAGDQEAQRGLRFAIFHLNGAVNPRDSRASIAARGLTGDGYIGHVFWDTDIFMLPFYTFTWPEAARSLLEYRSRTLPAVRAKARRLGFQGALYAWESTDTGEEATPPYALGPRGEVIAIRNGDLEQHVSAAVAYAVWQYWQATHDVDFLLKAGAEILLETARFWASRPQREGDGLYHIHNVIGPDEYHQDVDDSAYTTYMARWNIERGLETVALLKRRWPEHWQHLARLLSLTGAELDTWRSTAISMYLPQDAESGLVEQFAGYFGLDDIEVPAFPGRSAPMDVLLGPERTRRSQVIKQADVLMLMALLPDVFSLDAQQRNFEYYEPRCGHGSSLSPPIHSLLAARLGRMNLAERYFHQTADIDLNDSMGNSAAGLHMGALGGLWQAAVFGFGGITQREDGLALNPRLPPSWSGLRFPIRWRQRRLTVDVSQERRLIEVTLEQGRPMTMYVDGNTHHLGRGRPVKVPLLPREDESP